jgi:predicted RNA-binding Zn-ribbon protein involved in translation (DUF1610 family)
LENKEPRCQSCGNVIRVLGTVGRRDSCPACGDDLHACVQCAFYDLSASDQCREPQAERVGDKQQANFCEFFRSSPAEVAEVRSSGAQDARARLEALFKK